MVYRTKKAPTTAEELLGECEMEAEELTGMLEELKRTFRTSRKVISEFSSFHRRDVPAT